MHAIVVVTLVINQPQTSLFIHKADRTTTMSISQSSEVPVLAGGFITLDTVIKPTSM